MASCSADNYHKLAANSTGSSLTGTKKFTIDGNVPARLQWLANEGYCGEVSQTQAGLFYGQYVSQFDARTFGAVTKTNIQSNGKNFYLPGDTAMAHDHVASLLDEEFHSEEAGEANRYLAWAKKHLRQGHVVIITVMMNNYLFYGSTDLNAGFPDYDHIVTLTKIETDYDDDEYHADDLYTMEDHGLYSPRFDPVYHFTYTAHEFQGTRQQANAPSGNVYTVPNDFMNFGTAVLGVLDDEKVTLPVRVDTSVNYEKPIMRNGNDRPAPMDLTLTVTVSGMEDGVKYKLYKYNDETLVPHNSFNKHASKAVASYDINGSSTTPFVMTEKISSSDKCFYRAVRADAK